MFDLHSHILPGLDDGAEDLDQSLAMARMAVEDGIEGIVCTPHWVAGRYENTRPAIQDGVQALARELEDRGISLPLFAGAELRLHETIQAGIQNGHLVTINDSGRFALIELPDYFSMDGLEHFFFGLQLQGITPIISHPERNYRLLNNPTFLYRLVKSGALTQLTAASVLGFFGAEVRKFSFLLLKHNLCHILATDAHETKFRAPRLSDARNIVAEIVGETSAWRMVREIPLKVIEGKDVTVPEAIPVQTHRRGISRFFFWK